MKNPNDHEQNLSNEGGFDYESAYSAAENAKLDPKEERASRAEKIEALLEKDESPRETRARLREVKDRAKLRKRIIIAGVILVAAALIVIAAVFVIRYKEKQNMAQEEDTLLEICQQRAIVREIYTYGTHLNMSGELPKEAISGSNDMAVDLVLYDDEDFITVPIHLNGNSFSLSEQYNGGLYLETIERDIYKLFIRVTSNEPVSPEDEETDTDAVNEVPVMETEPETASKTEAETSSGPDDSDALQKKKSDEPETEEEVLQDEEEAETEGGEDTDAVKYYRYYALTNESDYQETVYYTMSSKDNCIVIGNETEYPTMQMTVSRNINDDVYDVVIDPAHGGEDQGAAGIDGHHEKDFLLRLALKIKDYLEKEGLKVALTRDNDSETLVTYGDDGRITRACRTEAKYMLSLHMNDEGYGMSGLMIYAYPDLDYTFAEMLNENIKEATGIRDASALSTIGSNIFTKMLTQAEIEQNRADDIAAGLVPYEPTLRSAYHYMIRESGGIVTGAFKDSRNPNEKYNPYCYDNTGIETYILQLGYITDQQDINLMINNMDGYAKAISESLISIYK